MGTMDRGASFRGTRCGRLAPAMGRCECAETPFAEVGRRLARGRSLDEVQVETGVGLLCTACLPDLHAYLAAQPADEPRQPPAGDEREPVDPAA